MDQITDLAAGIGEWLSVPAPLAGAAIMGALVGWLCWRTRSTHPVLVRVWRLLMGGAAMSDREIGALVESRDRLLKFRFLFVTRVRTLAQARRLGRWSVAHDEDLADVNACGPLFDHEQCRIAEDKLPSPRRQLLRVVLVACAICAGMLFAAGFATDRALLQFRASKVVFTLAPDSAKALSSGARVTPANCTGAPQATGPFSADEMQSLCEAFAKPDTAAVVRDAVKQQRSILGPLALAALCMALTLLGALRAGDAARSMQRRLDRRRVGGTSVGAHVPGLDHLRPTGDLPHDQVAEGLR
ncbi:MAG: DUF6216 family protein [Rhizobacter sp.]